MISRSILEVTFNFKTDKDLQSAVELIKKAYKGVQVTDYENCIRKGDAYERTSRNMYA